jgi:hypothetical protein
VNLALAAAGAIAMFCAGMFAAVAYACWPLWARDFERWRERRRADRRVCAVVACPHCGRLSSLALLRSYGSIRDYRTDPTDSMMPTCSFCGFLLFKQKPVPQ